MDVQSMRDLIEKFGNQKILVFGDLMLDQFVWGQVDRVSPEAPVPVVDVEQETRTLGGAGNVARNARSLGATVFPVGIVGRDGGGDSILQLLEEQKIETGSVIRTARKTTVKTRIIAHQQQVVRVDREQRDPVEESVAKALKESFLEQLPEVDGIIVSDYSKGTVTSGLLSEILPAAKKAGKVVCLDPKPRHFSSYSPVTAITPNQKEAGRVVGFSIETSEDLEKAGRRILEMVDCQALLITMGEKGMALFADGSLTVEPAHTREVYDVTGAGDTVITVLCLALAAGADFVSAMKLTNIAAGIVVGKLGTAVVNPEELVAEALG